MFLVRLALTLGEDTATCSKLIHIAIWVELVVVFAD